MSRLIDADELKDLMFVGFMKHEIGFIKMIENVINDCPTVDAVPVVRCKDCKYLSHRHEGMSLEISQYLCMRTNREVVPFDDFCSRAKRYEKEYGGQRDGAQRSVEDA